MNFHKWTLAAEILRDMVQYQSQPYNLARCKPVFEWMKKQLAVHGRYSAAGDELYDLSLEIEPREKEEERVTRMLHDSVGGLMRALRPLGRDEGEDY